MTKKEIINQIENISIADIVKTAMEAWLQGREQKDGYAVFNIETKELESIALAPNEEIKDNKLVFLYKIPANILGNNGYDVNDWLSPDEALDFETRVANGEYLSPEEYVEEYIEDSIEERLEEILLYYLETEDLDWDSIEWQIDRILSSQRVKFTTNINEDVLKGIKKRAIEEGRNVNEIIEEQLRKYLEEVNDMKKIVIECLEILSEEQLLNSIGEKLAEEPERFPETIENMADYFEGQSREYVLDALSTSSLVGADDELAIQEWIAEEETERLKEDE